MSEFESQCSSFSAPTENPALDLSLTNIQEKISNIFETSLKIRPSLNDDFFDLGGTSLGLVEVITEISKELKVDVDPSIVLGGVNVAALAYSIFNQRRTRHS